MEETRENKKKRKTRGVRTFFKLVIIRRVMAALGGGGIDGGRRSANCDIDIVYLFFIFLRSFEG